MHKTRTRASESSGSGMFLLADKRGGYALFGDRSFTHHAGLFFMLPDEWTLVKTIDDLRLDVAPTSLTNKFASVLRHSGEAVEEFYLFDRTLFYDVDNHVGQVTLDLDCRRVYDESDQGRFYSLGTQEGLIVVEYEKYADSSRSGVPERFFVVIAGAPSHEALCRWEHREYPFDHVRGIKAERWIFSALTVPCAGSLRLSFTVGTDRARTIAAAKEAQEERGLVRAQLKRLAHVLSTTDEVPSSTAAFALESLLATMDRDVNRTGIMAGLPWFFQFWARDELIAVHGLVIAEQYALVKEILFWYVDRIDAGADGRLPNRVPPAGLGSADAAGWLWKRVGDFIMRLDRKGILKGYFTQEELGRLAQTAERSLRDLLGHHVEEGLVRNGPGETWMDTHGGVGDVRAGVRIEVQSLTLASLDTCDLLCRLSKRTFPKELRAFQKELSKKVREVLFQDNVLHDGFDGALDRTLRPNVFIAAYLTPSLLSKKEWMLTFDVALKSLWLDWGGLASIAKDHPWYQPKYTGNNDRSYHRGDSWYWVNNLAAIAMRRVDPIKYRDRVNRLRDASVHDLLWLGISGHASEVSSAEAQRAEGCLAQAWSAATLLELLDELGE